MNTQKSTRKKFTSLLATATAALVAVGGMALAPSAAFADEPAAPAVRVSKTTLNPEGDLITVTGSGFLPNAPLTNGTRPPLLGKFGGSYVVFGSFLDDWKPSKPEDPAPSSARKALVQKWGVHAADMASIGGPQKGAIEIKPDGTFSANLVVSKNDAEALADGNYGIYTYGGGGAVYAPFETYTPLAFNENTPAPAVTASADGVRGKLNVTFSLANINSSTGAYISLIEAGTADQLSQTNLGIESDWVMPGEFVSGAATRTLSVSADKLDRDKQYEIVSWKGHTFPNAGEVYALGTPLEVAPEQWDKVFAPADVSTTTLKASKDSITEGDTVDLTATVSVAAGAAQGNVAFFSGTAQIGTAQKLASSKATLKAVKLAAGSQKIVAKFTPEDVKQATPSESAAITVTVKAKPEVKAPFTDVKKGQKFYNEIAWMYTAKVTTGVKQADGSVKYMPKANVTREAMAAFLFRQYGDKNYQAPKTSKFTDVKYGDKFYKEIAWMDSKGYSTGVKQANGSVKYMPKANVTREAMAAFIYRIEKGAGTGKSVVFNDVKPGQKFFKEINWMSGTGITTGIKQSNGTYNYAPKANVTREAMAAFLYRADKL